MANEHRVREADRLIRRGVFLAARGRREQALALLERGVQLNAHHPWGRLHLGVALAGEGAYADAIPHVRRAVDLQPESAAFHIFAGRVFFDAEDHDAAREAFARAVALSPANDLAAGYEILAEWAAGSVEAARRLAPDSLPDSTPLLARLLMLIESEMRGRSADAVDEERPVAFLDRVRVAYLLWRAGLQGKRGRFAEASGLADIALEMAPGHPAAVAFQKECRAAALGYARRRVDEDPQSVAARIELAGHLADIEEFGEAMAQIEEAERLLGGASDRNPPQSPEVHRLRGRILYGLDRIAEAVEEIAAGAEPGFSMPETHYYLGLCRLAQGKRHLCLAEFESLAAAMCWAVPLRLREFLAWRGAERPPESPSETQTSP